MFRKFRRYNNNKKIIIILITIINRHFKTLK